MTPRRILLMLPLLALMAASAVAQNVTSFDFLRIPVSARAAAMGNTFVTMKDDPAMLFYNPAGISTIEKKSASIGFTKYLVDVNLGHAVYSQEIEDIGWMSAGIVYMNYGEMDRTDKFAQKSGTFGASDLAFSIGYGNVYENLNYGAAVKVIYSGIDEYSSMALAGDVGAMYTLPEENITIGLALLSVGAQLDPFVDAADGGGSKEELPFEIRFGVSHRLKHLPLNLMLNFHKLNETDNMFGNFSIGGEFILSKALRARFGYNAEQRRELKIGNSAGFTGISLGFGLKISIIQLDYGYNDFGEIGALHRFGLSTTFD